MKLPITSFLQRQFFDSLSPKNSGGDRYGSLKASLTYNIHLTVPGQDNERLLLQLDERGIRRLPVGPAARATKFAFTRSKTADERRPSALHPVFTMDAVRPQQYRTPGRCLRDA